MKRRCGWSLQVLALAGAFAWSLSACGSDPSDQGSADLAAARPSGGGSSGGGGSTTGPKVSAVDPDTVAANSSLVIRVLGSGFTTGSRVDWAIKGVTTTKVTTSGPVQFISSKELQAPVTVASDAQLTSYDVVVTTNNGKKGIGVEMLLVVAEMIVLPEPSGFVRSGASDVTDGGVIVGWGSNATDVPVVGLRWTPTGAGWTVEQLGEGGVIAINESGFMLRSHVDGPQAHHYAVRPPSGSEVHFSSEMILEAIGNSGTLAGELRTSDTTVRPAAWRMSGGSWGSPIVLPLPAGWTAWINDINDRDDIVGAGRPIGDPNEWGMVWRFNGAGWDPMQPIDTEFGGAGLAINVNGSISGAHWPSLTVGTCASRAAYWAAPGATRQLLATPLFTCGAGGAKVKDMNNADRIAGDALLPLQKGANEWHAVVWMAPADPAPLDLGALKPMSRTSAEAINDGRLVVGWTYDAAGSRHATAWRLP